MHARKRPAMIEQNPRYISRLTQQTLALVLAGGKGNRLRPLTAWRSEPALPFGGKFRIIDFPLSNCLNSGIRRIGVLTQYKSYSLITHIQQGWGFLRGESGEFVELLPAQQRVNQSAWYRGTADAVYQNIDIIRNHKPEYVVILAGDQIYKMDLGLMLAYHVDRKADVTLACTTMPTQEACHSEVIVANYEGRVIRFQNKPTEPESLPEDENLSLVTMGAYIFNTELLYQLLFEDAQDPTSTHEFAHDVLPRVVNSAAKTIVYPFKETGSPEQAPYWRDMTTIDAYWQANIELVHPNPVLNMYDKYWTIWTYQEQLPPAKFVYNPHNPRGVLMNSMISGGCVIRGARVDRSILFSNVEVNNHSILEEALILPHVTIGTNCRLRRVLLDRRCQIPDNTVIGFDPIEDAKRFFVTDKGIVLVTPEMLGQKHFI